MMARDRREYHRTLRATPGYQDLQRAKDQARKLDPVYAAKERERERLRSIKRRSRAAEQLNREARVRHAERMANDVAYREAKARHALRWIKANPAKALANVARRDAQKLRAIPAWADKDEIRAIYAAAAASRLEVDHIVPLRSPFVCGLHVSANLQLIASRDNKTKGNRHWPDR